MICQGITLIHTQQQRPFDMFKLKKSAHICVGTTVELRKGRKS